MAAAVAVGVTGYVTWLPVVLVAGVAVECGVVDRRSGVIPNGLVLTALAVTVMAIGPVTVFDDRLLATLTVDLLTGWAMSGAPALLAVWLVAPRLIGGGDWKLLSVLGLAIGYVAPLAATVLLIVALGFGLVDAALRRRRHIALGPALAAGFVVAVLTAVLAPQLFGGWIATVTSR